jgi:hypothetical protein
MTHNQKCARNLIKRALDAVTQSESDLLIASARSLDPQTNTEGIKAEWLEMWLYKNQNRFMAGE